MTLLRSQSILEAESRPKLRTPVPRVSLYITSCFSSLSGPQANPQSLPQLVCMTVPSAGLEAAGKPQQAPRPLCSQRQSWI